MSWTNFNVSIYLFTSVKLNKLIYFGCISTFCSRKFEVKWVFDWLNKLRFLTLSLFLLTHSLSQKLTASSWRSIEINITCICIYSWSEYDWVFRWNEGKFLLESKTRFFSSTIRQATNARRAKRGEEGRLGNEFQTTYRGTTGGPSKICEFVWQNS